MERGGYAHCGAVWGAAWCGSRSGAAGRCRGAEFARSSADAVTADGPSTTATAAQATAQGLRRDRDQDLFVPVPVFVSLVFFVFVFALVFFVFVFVVMFAVMFVVFGRLLIIFPPPPVGVTRTS
ncbi:hypothetical protein [Streptomyces acidicola]|uniref:hypothetical protein n=1 Tax=Streptomyces acidicola TaxID=2596892 RepID=UPI0018833E71